MPSFLPHFLSHNFLRVWRRPQRFLQAATITALSIGATLVVSQEMQIRTAEACGPDFPTKILLAPDHAMRSAPEASFYAEMGYLARQQKPLSALPTKTLPKKERDRFVYDSYEYYDGDTLTESANLTKEEKKMLDESIQKYQLEYYGDTTRRAELIDVTRAALSNVTATNATPAAQSAAQTKAAAWRDIVMKMRQQKNVRDAAAMSFDLPDEFRLYTLGAIAYNTGEYSLADEYWRELLNLSPQKRKYRTTWALFMIARNQLPEYILDDPDSDTEDPNHKDKDSDVNTNTQDAAVKNVSALFADLRRAIQDGFEDSLDLASNSFGLEAMVLLRTNNGVIGSDVTLAAYERAIQLYLEQGRSGVEDNNSLLFVARALIKSGNENLKKAAAYPNIQRVVTAYLLSLYEDDIKADLVTVGSYDGPQIQKPVETWLYALDTLSQHHIHNVTGADRIAWLAYRKGWFDAAQRWLTQWYSLEGKMDEPKSAMANWIQAKIFLRRGQKSDAAQYLRAAAAGFPTDTDENRWFFRGSDGGSFGYYPAYLDPKGRILAEQGILSLQKNQFLDAFTALEQSGYWHDAAYIGERLVTVDQLKKYVDDKYPPVLSVKKGKSPTDNVGAAADGAAAANPDANSNEEEYMWPPSDGSPESVRAFVGRRLVRANRFDEAKEYLPRHWHKDIDMLKAGLNDAKNEKLTPEERAKGYWKAAWVTRTLGMELMGSELGPDWATYAGEFGDDEDIATIRNNGKGWQFAPTKNEKKKIAATKFKPNKRFHYRYVAANYALQGARLLPNSSRDAAVMLCYGHKWLMNRDPDAASVYYREFIKRNYLFEDVGFSGTCPDLPRE